MSVLVTADLHLTDRPADAHRWGLFPWLAKQAVKYEVEYILLLGDLTDAKDRHSAALTNKMVTSIRSLVDTGRQVIVLRGNHDYIDELEPFFSFLHGEANTQFLIEPKLQDGMLFLPNTRDYKIAWAGLDFSKPKYIFCHQTFDGCLTENGTRLDGIPPSVFGKIQAKVISGDIHVAQRIGKNIEYVGAPYRIRFGDVFEPRVLLIQDDGKFKDLHFPTKQKHLIEIKAPSSAANAVKQLRATHRTGEVSIYEGDQVKVRVHLKRSAYPEWPAIRAALIEEAAASKLELTGPELMAIPEDRQKSASEAQAGPPSAFAPGQALNAYAENAGASGALLKAGQVWLKEAIGGK
jgi:DNA repair exonuclease SbcCD nuclease subunit